MQLTISNSELTSAVDQIMKERGYVPESSIAGKTIGIKEFAQKYCYPHGIDWVKENILYKFHPDWIVSIHPGSGKGFTIFEDEAAQWMVKHRKEINWKNE